MKPFITIEIQGKKRRPTVGLLYAEDTPDAYTQLECDHPIDQDEKLAIDPSSINQLIIDLNRVVRKI